MSKTIAIVFILAVLSIFLVVFRNYSWPATQELTDQDLDQMASVSQADEAADLDEYLFEAEEFRILTPAGWDGYYDFDGTLLALASVEPTDQETMMLPDSVLMIEFFPKEGMSLEEFKDSLKQDISAENEDNVQINQEAELININYPARYLEFVAQLEDRELMRVMALIEAGDNFWSIFMDLPPAEWPARQAVFQQVVESFELK